FGLGVVDRWRHRAAGGSGGSADDPCRRVSGSGSAQKAPVADVPCAVHPGRVIRSGAPSAGGAPNPSGSPDSARRAPRDDRLALAPATPTRVRRLGGATVARWSSRQQQFEWLPIVLAPPD